MALKEELLKLGIKIKPEIVQNAVRRLHGGQSLYPLYHPAFEGASPALSKTTAFKIKRLYEAGQLDFLLHEIQPEELVDRLYPLTRESHEQRVERVQAQEQEDLAEVIEALKVKPPPGYQFELDGFAFHRMRVIDALPVIDWSVSGLESAHIPEKTALILLSEYDELHIKRVESEVHTYEDAEDSQSTLKRWMRDFRGIDRYIALHYLVQFAAAHKRSPYAILERAATLKAKGDLELDNRLQVSGLNLVRYEVWRGPDYVHGYLEATKAYYGTKKQRDRLEAEVEALVERAKDRTANYEEDQNDGEAQG